MHKRIHHPNENLSNEFRKGMVETEPKSLRTYTPTQAVLAESSGIFHWTPEGRRLYDFTSGVLVANLGHNSAAWMNRFLVYMGYRSLLAKSDGQQSLATPAQPFFRAAPLTAYNAITPVEVKANQTLLKLMRGCPGGARLEKILWAASGSEAVQKALWASLARSQSRDIILATRFGFHGKKGLSQAITGSETDHDRDPRVKFISFPMKERLDVSQRMDAFDFTPYAMELRFLKNEFGNRITALCTEPYLGGGGSYHPPTGYLQGLQNFCRENDILFILDEVQSNFGRTGSMFAFQTYGLEPDLVILGKGLGNGVAVAAVVGRGDILDSLDYGEASDTWSANPMQAAATLATLEEFHEQNILAKMKVSSAILEEGLLKLKQFPFVAHLRGEHGGMVWGLEFKDYGGVTGPEWANRFVLANYLGSFQRKDSDFGKGQIQDGIHFLGPLAKKVIRISPPLIIKPQEASDAVQLMHLAGQSLAIDGAKQC